MKLTSVIVILASASLSQQISLVDSDPSTGAIIPICNGANTGHCTTADDVVVKKIRRDGKRAAPGDPDFAD